MLDLLTSLAFGWYYILGWLLERMGILKEGSDPHEFVRKITDDHPILHFVVNVLLATTILTGILFGSYLLIVEFPKAQKEQKKKSLLKPNQEEKPSRGEKPSREEKPLLEANPEKKAQ